MKRHVMKTIGYAALSADAKLVPYHFKRRELRDNDIAIVAFVTQIYIQLMATGGLNLIR